MIAVQIDSYGGPENMVLRNVATPEPGPGEALVRIEYAGVNYTDQPLTRLSTKQQQVAPSRLICSMYGNG